MSSSQPNRRRERWSGVVRVTTDVIIEEIEFITQFISTRNWEIGVVGGLTWQANRGMITPSKLRSFFIVHVSASSFLLLIRRLFFIHHSICTTNLIRFTMISQSPNRCNQETSSGPYKPEEPEDGDHNWTRVFLVQLIFLVRNCIPNRVKMWGKKRVPRKVGTVLKIRRGVIKPFYKE